MSDMVKLRDYVSIKTGKLDANASNINGQYPFFTCSIQPLRIDNYSYDCECVLVAGNGDLNVKYYNGKFDAYQRTYIIESNNKNVINNKYLYYLINSKIEHLRKNSIGGVIKYIKLGNLTNIEFNKINIQEQEECVDLLDKMQEIIDIRKQQIEELDELIKSQFVDMFGNPIENSKNFTIKKLGNICKIYRGASPRPINKYLNGTVPWIKIGDATKGDGIYLNNTKEKITEEGAKKSRLIKKGGLIFANCGVSLGFARIIKFDGCIHDGWLAFENYEEVLNPIFFLQSLNFCTKHFRAIAPDGTQPNLNTDIMKNYMQIVPDMKRQLEFAEFVKKTDKQKFEIQKSLEEIQKLQESLMNKYFG